MFDHLPGSARSSPAAGCEILIDLHEAWASPCVIKALLRVTRLAAGICCLAAAWITAKQTWSEYSLGVLTNTYMPIPKWWLFIFIPYGLLERGMSSLRQTSGETPHQSAGAVP